MDWMKQYRLWTERTGEEPELFNERQAVKAESQGIVDKLDSYSRGWAGT